jgi:hypothetical protein
MPVLSGQLSRYEALGLSLIIFGVPLSAYAHYVLLNTPFTALGVACIVLGASLMIVPGNPVPAVNVRAMVEGSCVNVEALLEEFDAKEKAVYLPPRDDRVFAYVPLHGGSGETDFEYLEKVPLRVLVDVGGSPGLFVFPPGSEVVRLSLLPEDSGIEDALQYVLVDYLEGVRSVKAIRESDKVVVEVNDPRLRTDFPRFQRVLGSLTTSVSGCVLSSVLGKPSLFVEEEINGGRIRSVFRVIDGFG